MQGKFVQTAFGSKAKLKNAFGIGCSIAHPTCSVSSTATINACRHAESLKVVCSGTPPSSKLTHGKRSSPDTLTQALSPPKNLNRP